MSRAWILVAAAIVAACSRTPPSPSVPSEGEEQVSGTERLGWDQRAADTVELATFRYAVYVDGTRSELTGVSCAAAAAAAGFACAARLPPLSPGRHTLQLASFVVEGGVLESARSASLNLNVVPAAAARTLDEREWPAIPTVTTSDGVTLRLDLVAGDLDHPTALAFAPGGRIFVAERAGPLRVVRDGRLLARGVTPLDDVVVADGGLLGLAVDPQFERTRFVFVVYTAASRAGDAVFRVARLREAGDTFADRVVLLDSVRASSAPAASLQFGPDGRLYVAVDDGGDAALGGDLASPNGKVLRLNPDGTTPDDQAGASPVYASQIRSPRGLDWQPASGTLWVADVAGPAAARLHVVDVEGDRARKRGVTRAVRPLPRLTIPSSIAFYRDGGIAAFAGNLFVASGEGRHLLRITFDPADATRIVATEPLLQDQVGGVHAVATGPDGAIYFCSADAVGRLTASRR